MFTLTLSTTAQHPQVLVQVRQHQPSGQQHQLLTPLQLPVLQIHLQLLLLILAATIAFVPHQFLILQQEVATP